MIQQELQQFGFSKGEAMVYSLLLQNSPSGATFIAKKCNLSRSSVYTLLDALMRKGLADVTYKNEIKQFIAHGKDALEVILEKEQQKVLQKQKLFENLKKNIDILQKNNLSMPEASFFEGKTSSRRIYWSMLRTAPQNSKFYIIRDEFIWTQPDWEFLLEDRWTNAKREKNIQTYVLSNKMKLEKKDKKFQQALSGLHARLLSKEDAVHNFALNILADTVMMWSMQGDHLIGVKIVDQHFANNYRTLFEALWRKAKQVF